jgi:hypothetical protein
MKKSRVVLVLLLVGTAGQIPSIASAEGTVYFEETFENESVGSVVHQTDFESGTDGWAGELYILLGSDGYVDHRSVDSSLVTTGRGPASSLEDRYHIRQRRFIEIPESGTYHLYVRGDAGFPDGQDDAEIYDDRVHVDGKELPLDHGRETHHSIDLPAGNHTFERDVQFFDSDTGRVNGTATLERFALLRDTRRRVGPWESDGFPMYTDTALDGTALFARSVSASINASPAQNHDPVVFEFDIRTGSDSADWSLEQSGYTIAGGSVDPEHRRRIRRAISLQDGRFSLDVDSRDTVAIDNVRVLGYDQSAADGRTVPSVPLVDRASAKSGYDTLLGSLDGVVGLGLDTATYLALFGIAAGAVFFVVGRRRDGRGLLLVVGSASLLVSVLVFAPVLSTVSWIFSGESDHPSLAEPDLSATSTLYRDDFEGGSLAGTDWRRVAGQPGDAFLDGAESGSTGLVLREGAVVETTVPVDRSGVDHGTLTVDASVESAVDQAPPDEDALSLTLESDGSTVIEEPNAAVATGGDTVDRTLGRRVELSGSNLTIRIGARDTNGGDDRARITVSQVLIRGAP